MNTGDNNWLTLRQVVQPTYKLWPQKTNGQQMKGFTLQAIDSKAAQLNSETGVADVQGGLIWESTIFYHKESGGCYR